MPKRQTEGSAACVELCVETRKAVRLLEDELASLKDAVKKRVNDANKLIVKIRNTTDRQSTVDTE